MQQKHKQKDFNSWNEEKKALDKASKQLFFKEREIWWCKWGVNIGYEQDGGDNFLRPVLVLIKFDNNTFIAVPLTKSNKKHKLRIDVGVVLGKEAKANISQIKVCDKRRLFKKISTLNKGVYDNVVLEFKRLLK